MKPEHCDADFGHQEASETFSESGNRRKFGEKTQWPSWDHSLWSHPSSHSHVILFSITWEIGMLKKRIHICCNINFTFLTSSWKSLFPTLRVQHITTSSIFLMRLTNHHSGKRTPIAKRYHSFTIGRRPPIWMEWIMNPNFYLGLFFNVFLLLKIFHYNCSWFTKLVLETIIHILIIIITK